MNLKKVRLSEALKEFRKETGRNQYDMARDLDVSIATYRNWELMTGMPNQDNLKKLEEMGVKYEN